jgi:hypothetical protein
MDKPRLPAPPRVFVAPIDRKDSGAFTRPVEEAVGVGGVPSLAPPGEEPTRAIAVRAQEMAEAALSAVKTLRGEVEGSKVGQEEFIKNTITTAIGTGLDDKMDAKIAPILTTLGQQNGEMLSQRLAISKISRGVTALLTDEQNAAVRKLELAERAAHISSHEINVEVKREELKIGWVKKYSAYIKFVLALIALVGVIAGWAGYSNLAHPHGATEEKPG